MSNVYGRNYKAKWFFCNWNDGHLIECDYPMTLKEAVTACGGWKSIKGFTIYSSKEKFLQSERRFK